ncbi:FxSxx-COOH system tetratricopeptide repeat protein [Streptomyces chartreusis]|uniref:FxSxx-COOH system tetratricopeptide repeat protein n=1 Tax=Streptomyces chartreusis TaxID=1969 RepID=UPI003D937A11
MSLGRVLGLLADSGIKMSPEELLDALWLARHLPQSTAAPFAQAVTIGINDPSPTVTVHSVPEQQQETSRADSEKRPPATPLRGSGNDGMPQSSRRPREPRRSRTAEPGLHAAESPAQLGSMPALPVKVPEERALTQNELPLGRALRPLKRTRRDSRAWELDEQATVATVADTGLLDVVMRPVQTRWLDLVLLVDDGVSMLLWRRLVTEVRQLLERTGAFRTVRVHGLDSRSSHAPRILARPYQNDDRASAPPLNATESSMGSTLLLFMSDGVGTAWHDGRMHAVLARLARLGPTAVIHTLPEPLREYSGIKSRQWRVTTRRAGAANQTWEICDPVLPPELLPFDGLPVPVLELSPTSVETWARLVSNRGATAELPLLTPAMPALPTPSEARFSARDAGQELLTFRAVATPEAYRLAAHLAAVAPLTVPVMRLVQSALGDHVHVSHLAEVFLGGLMLRTDAGGETTHPERRLFDFPEYIRRILLSTVPMSELRQTRYALGARLQELTGQAPDFSAWLADKQGTGRISGTGLPFALADEQFLTRLGLPSHSSWGDQQRNDRWLHEERPNPPAFVGRQGCLWVSLQEGDPTRLGAYIPFARNARSRGQIVEYLARSKRAAIPSADMTLLRVPSTGVAETDRALVQNEVRALERLISLSAPSLRSVADGEVPWLAVTHYMDPATGEPAEDLATCIRGVGRIEGADFARLGARLASAVARAHGKQIIHGALTPDRVLLAGREVLVTDWTSASIDGSASPHRRMAEEERIYRAPELSRFPAAEPTEASDVYALGVVLLAALTGTLRPAVPGETQEAPFTEGSRGEIQRVVYECLRLDPRERPAPSQISRAFRAHLNSLSPAPGRLDKEPATGLVQSRQSMPGHSLQPLTLLISYAAVDVQWAEWIAWHLDEAGHNVILDVPAAQDIDGYVRHMRLAVQSADRVVLVLSRAYLAPQHWEENDAATTAFRRGQIIPLAVESLDRNTLRGPLAAMLRTDLFGLDEQAALTALLGAVNGPAPVSKPPAFPSSLHSTAVHSAPQRPPMPSAEPNLEVWKARRRNPQFIGREGILARVREQLRAERQPRVQVLLGPSGAGKSQIALEYAHRFAGYYDLVWWVDASDVSQIPVSYHELDSRLRIDDTNHGVNTGARLLMERLRTRERWLIILDDAEEPREIAQWVPEGPGNVLITSRNPRWTSMAQSTSVEFFTRAESVSLLAWRLPQMSSQEADTLAEILGDHPLALTQAAGVLSDGMHPDHYRQLVAGSSSRILMEGAPPDYPTPLAATVMQAVSRVEGQPHAKSLVHLAAFLGPEPIPIDWALRFLAHHELIEPSERNVLTFSATLQGLARLGLVSVEFDSFQMHRLTQAVVRDRVGDVVAATVLQQVCEFLAALELDDPEEPATWPNWAQFTAHLTAPHLQAADRYELRPHLLRAIDYLMLSNRSDVARALIVELQPRWSESLGRDHPYSLNLADKLGTTLQQLGNYQDALGTREETLQRSSRILGGDHPDTLDRANSFARTLIDLHRYQEAIAILRGARTRSTRALGQDHPLTKSLTRALAVSLTAAGRAYEAQKLLRSLDGRSPRRRRS